MLGIRVALLVLVGSLVGSGAPRHRAAPKDSDALWTKLDLAQRALRKGHDREARPRLDAILGAAPKWPPARILEASLELEEGHPSRARGALAILRGPGQPAEARILEALADRRAGHPHESWSVSFRAAWNADGRRPIGRKGYLVMSGVVIPSFEGAFCQGLARAAWRARDPQRRLILADTANRMGRGPKAPPVVPDPPRIVKTPGLALSILEDQRTGPKVPTYARRLQAHFPKQAMDFALWATEPIYSTEMCKPCIGSIPLTAKDVAKIDAISRLPSGTNVLPDTARAVVATLRPWGATCALGEASLVTAGVSPGFPLGNLEFRAKVSVSSLDARTRRRLAAALWRIGLKLTRRASLGEKQDGYRALVTACAVFKNAPASAAAKAYWRVVTRVVGESADVPWYLPVPALQHELDRAQLRDGWGSLSWFVARPGQPPATLPQLPADPFGDTGASPVPGPAPAGGHQR